MTHSTVPAAHGGGRWRQTGTEREGETSHKKKRPKKRKNVEMCVQLTSAGKTKTIYFLSHLKEIVAVILISIRLHLYVFNSNIFHQKI